MNNRPISSLSHDIQSLFAAGSIASLSDGELLERYVTSRDHAAFEVIVMRHGPMVLGVCRRTLHDGHDAEDAFQATFMVLARKAASVVPREMVANWLYGVAYHNSLKSRAMMTRLRAREKQIGAMPESEAARQTPRDEWQPILDEELNRLPNKYRAPIVLCLIEGKSYREVAGQLGWTEGTLSGRLSRAKTLLASRLARRGLSYSIGSLPVLIARHTASASVRTPLMRLTAKTACLFAAGKLVVPGLVSHKVAVLTRGEFRMFPITKMIACTVMVIGATAVTGLGHGTGLPPAITSPDDLENAQMEPERSGSQQPAPDQPSTTSPVMYTVKCEMSQDGGAAIVAPGVTTLGGQSARIHLGSTANAPNGDVVPLGLVCMATPTLMQDGRICVNVRADRVERDKAETEGLTVQGDSLQIIKVVKLGEAINLEFKPTKGDSKGKPTKLHLTFSRSK